MQLALAPSLQVASTMQAIDNELLVHVTGGGSLPLSGDVRQNINTKSARTPRCACR